VFKKDTLTWVGETTSFQKAVEIHTYPVTCHVEHIETQRLCDYVKVMHDDIYVDTQLDTNSRWKRLVYSDNHPVLTLRQSNKRISVVIKANSVLEKGQALTLDPTLARHPKCMKKCGYDEE